MGIAIGRKAAKSRQQGFKKPSIGGLASKTLSQSLRKVKRQAVKVMFMVEESSGDGWAVKASGTIASKEYSESLDTCRDSRLRELVY
ncbi:hypothetical protein [Pseudanabaena sp. FACHB-2040]|uniref:hypothetical protein n=1 Tax=Pseudanabaena sp. FACHB-2040 TaxID=2692859 RepID=UPI001682A4CE|nr:hypothetical protein [Pseudanabaena sp. FACHB-2040]MBD2258067.1 hypothetical protein [Pseudanabaena sp. FACHB-2040]